MIVYKIVYSKIHFRIIHYIIFGYSLSFRTHSTRWIVVRMVPNRSSSHFGQVSYPSNFRPVSQQIQGDKAAIFRPSEPVQDRLILTPSQMYNAGLLQPSVSAPWYHGPVQNPDVMCSTYPMANGYKYSSGYPPIGTPPASSHATTTSTAGQYGSQRELSRYFIYLFI